MQAGLIAAAVIAAFVGVVHSILGEVLIFSKLRRSGFIPTKAVPPLKLSNVKILWATWHLVSVFGWAFAVVLLSFALNVDSLYLVVLNTTGVAFLAGSILVLVATRGRHPGWLGLLIVGLLIFYSQAS